MEMIPVIRFELQGLSAGLYHLLNDDDSELGWFVISTSTNRSLRAISFEHGRHLLDGCINEIRSRIGSDA